MDESPLAGIRVRLEDTGGRETTTDEIGNFDLRSAEPGPLEIVARREVKLGRLGSVVDEIRQSVESDSEIVLRFVTGRVTLLFREAATGEAAWPCRTTLSAAHGASGWGMTCDLPTDRLILRHDLVPGPLRFLVEARGFEPTNVEVDVPTDWASREIEFEVPLVAVRTEK